MAPVRKMVCATAPSRLTCSMALRCPPASITPSVSSRPSSSTAPRHAALIYRGNVQPLSITTEVSNTAIAGEATAAAVAGCGRPRWPRRGSATYGCRLPRPINSAVLLLLLWLSSFERFDSALASLRRNAA